MIWPWFVPPDLPVPIAAAVVSWGERYVIATAKIIAAVIAGVGLLMVGRSLWLFAFVVGGLGSMWLWNAFAFPQW